MRPFDFPLLADENVAPDVVTGLRERKCNVRTVGEEQLIGRPDTDVLARAVSQARIVVTHDLAFGRAGRPNQRAVCRDYLLATRAHLRNLRAGADRFVELAAPCSLQVTRPLASLGTSVIEPCRARQINAQQTRFRARTSCEQFVPTVFRTAYTSQIAGEKIGRILR